MDKSYHQLFEKIPVETPLHLNQVIIKNLRQKERQRVLKALWFNVGLMSVVTVVLAQMLYQLATSLSQIGLSTYATLVWYDQSLLLTYWREIGLWLLESTPVLSIALVLGLMIILSFSSLNTINSYRFKRLLIN